jgi:hypothetical protein
LTFNEPDAGAAAVGEQQRSGLKQTVGDFTPMSTAFGADDLFGVPVVFTAGEYQSPHS